MMPSGEPQYMRVATAGPIAIRSPSRVQAAL